MKDNKKLPRFTRTGMSLLVVVATAFSVPFCVKLYDGVFERGAEAGIERGTSKGIEVHTLSCSDEKSLMVQAFEEEKAILVKQYTERLGIKDKAIHRRDTQLANVKIAHEDEIARHKKAINTVINYKCKDLKGIDLGLK